MSDSTSTPPATATVTVQALAAPSVTPGYKTTEFWLNVAAMLLTVACASGFVSTGSTLAQIVTLAAGVLTSLGYTVSRSFVKANA